MPKDKTNLDPMVAIDIDEKLSEKEALKRAADDGIEFYDFYTIMDPSTFNQLTPDQFDTHAAAEKWAKKHIKGEYSIAQNRAQKPQKEAENE